MSPTTKLLKTQGTLRETLDIGQIFNNIEFCFRRYRVNIGVAVSMATEFFSSVFLPRDAYATHANAILAVVILSVCHTRAF